MLSGGTINELRNELKILEQQKLKIDVRVAGIKVVLEDQAIDVPITVPAGQLVSSGQRATLTVEPPQGTFRSKLLWVIREEEGRTSAEITEAIEARDWVPGGTTRTSTRVYNELWRLRRSNIIVKRDGRYYGKREAKKNEVASGM